MSDRLRMADDDTLGRAVHAVGERVAWPSSPDVVASVTQEIDRRAREPSLRRTHLPMSRGRRALVLAIIAVLVLAAAAVAAKLVIDLGALTVKVVPGRPTALPSVQASASDFGKPVTLAHAEAIAGFAPPIPAALGPPDRVWLDQAVTSFETDNRSTRLVMAWRSTADLPAIPGARWGAILIAFDGSADVAAKFVYAETGSIRHALVNGADAYWLVGPHELDLLGASGTEQYLVTGNVLVWNDDGVTVRLETAIGKRATIALASAT